MPYATCPNCGDTFHLKVGISPEEWSEKFPVSADGNRYLECFYCWKELKEHDSVEIIKLLEHESTGIAQGDKGYVVSPQPDNHYEVECKNADGSTKWLCILPRNCLKYVREKNR